MHIYWEYKQGSVNEIQVANLVVDPSNLETQAFDWGDELENGGPDTGRP